MFRVPNSTHQALLRRTFSRTQQPQHFHKVYEVGRKTVYESEQCKLVVERGVSIVVGYEGYLSDSMPMHNYRYQGIPVADANMVVNICKALYEECDPLAECDSNTDCTFWGYILQLIHVTMQRWKFINRVVFDEMKDIEAIARREMVGPESVYFCQSLDIDVLRCIDRVVLENELNNTFRYQIWGHEYDEYVEWFESLPPLFDLQVE